MNFSIIKKKIKTICGRDQKALSLRAELCLRVNPSVSISQNVTFVCGECFVLDALAKGCDSPKYLLTQLTEDNSFQPKGVLLTQAPSLSVSGQPCVAEGVVNTQSPELLV